MKALIVIEIDENHLLKETNELYGRLKGYKCELKPLPEKQKVDKTAVYDGYGNIIQSALARGFNACIGQILGEKDESSISD